MVHLESIYHLLDFHSLIKIMGHSNREMIVSYINIAALAAVFVLTASAFAHL